MGSKDIVPYALYESKSKRGISLYVNPNVTPSFLQDDPSPNSAATTMSPSTPGLPGRASSSDSETVSTGDGCRSGAIRSKSISGTREKEKRKRSRVTPDQLIHLERFFASDRSPTASRRREISDLLGMHERQTQIWFQNRRAKAKILEGRTKPPFQRQSSFESPPHTPPELASGIDSELQSLLHEENPVTIIPCTDLSVGSWHRIVTVDQRDLIAYVCEAKACLTWFIQSNGHSFKMDIPFHRIISAEFANASPGTGLATFYLSNPPIFYMEERGAEGRMRWKESSDWTEGFQATHVLCHNLIGSASQLAHVVRNLQPATNNTSMAFYSPSYEADAAPVPMEVPAPPMMGLISPVVDHETEHKIVYSSDASPHSSDSGMQYDGIHEEKEDIHPPLTAPAAIFPLSSQTSVAGQDGTTSIHYVYNEQGSPPYISSNHFGVPISRNLVPRPYSASHLQSTFITDTVVHKDHNAPGVHSSNYSHQSTPSSPLLTTPYQPPSYLTTNFCYPEADVENFATNVGRD